MGCDIHEWIEVRHDGVWRPNDKAVFPLDEFDRKRLGADTSARPNFCRSYALFGWLAGVRNYSDVPPISAPRGVPADASDEVRLRWYGDGDWNDGDHSYGCHNASWLSLAELLAFDYDRPVEDRRVERFVQIGRNPDGSPMGYTNCGATAEPGGGVMTTYREFLGGWWFDRVLEPMKQLGAPGDVRLVFWFDN